MIAESGETARAGGPGWKQPCLRPRLGIPPCRSSGGGWKTRFISPWQAGILLPIPARGAVFSLEFLDKHEHVLLVGPAGVGKSFLVQALGDAGVRAGHTSVSSMPTGSFGPCPRPGWTTAPSGRS